MAVLAYSKSSISGQDYDLDFRIMLHHIFGQVKAVGFRHADIRYNNIYRILFQFFNGFQPSLAVSWIMQSMASQFTTWVSPFLMVVSSSTIIR